MGNVIKPENYIMDFCNCETGTYNYESDRRKQF